MRNRGISAGGRSPRAGNFVIGRKVTGDCAQRGARGYGCGTEHKTGCIRGTFLNGEHECADRTFIGCVPFIVQVVLAPVAFGGGTNRVCLVRMVVFEQGVESLHQPEAEEENGEQACRQAARYGTIRAGHCGKYTGIFTEGAN